MSHPEPPRTWYIRDAHAILRTACERKARKGAPTRQAKPTATNIGKENTNPPSAKTLPIQYRQRTSRSCTVPRRYDHRTKILQQSFVRPKYNVIRVEGHLRTFHLHGFRPGLAFRLLLHADRKRIRRALTSRAIASPLKISAPNGGHNPPVHMRSLSCAIDTSPQG